MRLRELRIQVTTPAGTFARSLTFPDGLVVIWADNSMGKSTCVKSIVVALGLEAMLTTSQSELPLPPAVTSVIEDDAGAIHQVIESEVFLEIENQSGQRITVQRTIKGQREKDLITVILGPALTDASVSYPTQDYFVNRGGAATRELGFHTFLAAFMGWSLPRVQTYEGGEYPLYLQCIFPYFSVEQTRGWSTVVPPIPTHLRIRDPHKRVVEFLLNLDAHRNAMRRQELVLEQGKLEASWTILVKQAKELADRVSAVFRGLPEKPTSVWPPTVLPGLLVSGGQSWQALQDKVAKQRTELEELVEQEIPRVQQITTLAEGELANAETSLNQKETLLARLISALEMESSEFDSVTERLGVLDEDIQRNRDVRTLHSLGSKQLSTVTKGLCPYCHQSIKDSLVPLAPEQEIMSVEENIAFLSEQKRTYTLVQSNARKIVAARGQQLSSLRGEISDLREQIRGLRQTLVSDGRVPSVAAIQGRLRLEANIRINQDGISEFEKLIGDFRTLSGLWKANQEELAKMPREDASPDDKLKLEQWSRVLQEQLRQFEFRSLPADQVVISTDSYRPEHGGFDLPTSISASDLVRLIWAYLHGLLEISRTQKTNHPGFLVFDEPKQQSTKDVSFQQLLARVATARITKQQVVFFTSENQSRLRQHLGQLPHEYVEIKGRVLQRNS